jgi:hypothetical protein
MKITQGILGCAVAIGLATCSTSTVQAVETSFDNEVFTPLNIMLQVRYNDNKGKVREAVATSKDLLKLLGYPSKDQLATDYDGEGDDADVFVINKDGIVEDLTEDNILSVEFNPLVSKNGKNGKDDSFSESEKGIISFDFDFTQEESFAAIVPDGDAPPSGTETSFDVSGVYVFSETGAATKNDSEKITTNLNATNIQGDGEVNDEETSVKSNVTSVFTDGDFLLLHGTANGTGSGTVEIGG